MAITTSTIPEELRKKFVLFVDIFVPLDGPGPARETPKTELSAAQLTELEMFERFLEECQIPEGLRQRMIRKYIEEEFKPKEAGFETWVLRFLAVSILVTSIGLWWSSPKGAFPGYLILIALLFSILFFWFGERRKT
jgi:hypothetical protein